jgi:hypothetical protein
MKKSFSLAFLTLIVGCTASPLTWSDPSVVNTFMSTCNPKNDEGMKTICQCVIDKLKILYPDAAKADTIPQSEIETQTKACIK